jgi:hypothetical protein
VSTSIKAAPNAKAYIVVVHPFLTQLGPIQCTCRNAGEGIPDTNTMHQSHMCAMDEWKGNSVNWCRLIGNKQAHQARLFQDCWRPNLTITKTQGPTIPKTPMAPVSTAHNKTSL